MRRKREERSSPADLAASTHAPEGLSFLFVAAAALAVYLNTLSHDFVYDDAVGILGNPLVSGFDSLQKIWSLISEPWRPVTQLSFTLTRYFFGFDARAFPSGMYVYRISAGTFSDVRKMILLK